MIRSAGYGLKAKALSPLKRQFDQSLRAAPYRSYNKPVVYISGFYEGEKFRRKSTQSTSEESRPGMAEENHHGEFVPDMELCMVGEIEKESFKVTTPTS